MPVEKRRYQISGMHCSACEVLVERAFKHDPNVSRAKANQLSGYVDVWAAGELDVAAANQRLVPHGYSVQVGAAGGGPARPVGRLGGVVLLTVVLYIFFRRFNLVPPIGAGQDLSLSVVFVMGLVAAVSSCIAVTGGLLVAISSAHAQTHPNDTGWQKFRPHIFFNLGRLVSYAVLGAAVGGLGSALALSLVGSGVITLVASLAMLILGLKLLRIFPWLSRVALHPPKFIAHRLHDAAGQPKPWAPFLLGAGTFFLPCGFTQALQLYVLTRGEAGVGAAIMFVFALGTLPALAGLGAVTSFVKGRWQRVLATVAGAAVVALGLINLSYGFTLTGLTAKFAEAREALRIAADQAGFESVDPNVSIVDGVQVVRMDVVAGGYRPNRFTIRAGLPVRWEINGVNTYGCQSILQLPTFGITQYVRPGENVVEFTPQEPGQLAFHCAMGMFRGSFTVLSAEAATSPTTTAPTSPIECDPTITTCS